MPPGTTPLDLPPSVCANLGGCQGAQAVDLSLPPPTFSAQALVMQVRPTLIPNSSDTVGVGACATTSIASFVALVHEQVPELGDIDTFLAAPIYGQPPLDEAASYYQAAIRQETMLVVLRRCIGEVVDGVCGDEQLWFFRADGQCQPAAAGTYRDTLVDGCYQVEGGVPNEFSFAELSVPDPQRCDFDPMPEALSGTTALLGVVVQSFCGAQGLAPVSLRMTVAQDAANLSQAWVTLSGASAACIDGVSIRGQVVQAVITGEIFLDGPEGPQDEPLCAPAAKIDFRMGFGSERLLGAYDGSFDYSLLSSEGCAPDGTPDYVFQGGLYVLRSSPEAPASALANQ
jgi:hypothetical protein